MTDPRNLTRTLATPDELKAVSHPTRVAILEQLGYRGAMTATQVSELVGESPSNCSWHLRKLAEVGLVERAPGDDERARPWQLAFDSYDYTEAAAAGQVPGLVGRRQLDRLLRVVADPPQRPFTWGSNASWLTDAEVRQLRERLGEVEALLGDAEQRRRDPAARPPDAHLYEFVGWLIPVDEVL